MADTYFDESTHTYYVDGYVKPSVTFLLSKHGIAPSYDGVNSELLAYKAQRGTLIHEDIAHASQTGEAGISPESQHFVKYIYKMCKEWWSEVQLFGADYCGTVDLVGFPNAKEAWIIDTKTGQIHKDVVGWQTRMYARLLVELFPERFKGRELHYFVYDAKPDKSRLIEIEPARDTEIDRLIEAEKNGTIYTPSPLLVKPEVEERLLEFEKQIASLEKQKKELTSKRDAIYAEIKKQFEDKGVTEFETPTLRFKYVKPYQKEGFDKDTFALDHPRLFKQYHTTSMVSASLRVTVKKQEVTA